MVPDHLRSDLVDGWSLSLPQPNYLKKARCVASRCGHRCAYWPRWRVNRAVWGTKAKTTPIQGNPQSYDALLAAEDDGFFDHHGIEPLSLLRPFQN